MLISLKSASKLEMKSLRKKLFEILKHSTNFQFSIFDQN